MDHSSNRSGGSTCPFGQDEMYGRGARGHNRLVHELRMNLHEVIPELPRDVDGLWIHSPGRCCMGRSDRPTHPAQDGWARPLGDFNHRWMNALFRPIRPIKDFLNGTWLGHPLHAAATDIPIGALLLTVVLDLLGQTAAADVALVVDDPVHARRRGDRRGRLHRHGWRRPRPGDRPLDAHGRRAAAPADLARAAGRAADRPDHPHRPVDHRVPDRDRRRVRRRRRRLHLREHGQPPRVPRRRARNGSSSTPAT